MTIFTLIFFEIDLIQPINLVIIPNPSRPKSIPCQEISEPITNLNPSIIHHQNEHLSPSEAANPKCILFQDEIENATDDPTSGLEWSRGIFVNPGDKIGGTSRIDEGTSSIDRFSWLKNRHKWDWWQKSRQPRQPWASTTSLQRRSLLQQRYHKRRRRKRKRRLVQAS